MHSQENVQKPQIWPVSLSKNESFVGYVLLVGMYTVSFFIIIWKYVLRFISSDTESQCIVIAMDRPQPSSEGAQDTLAHQISGHSLHVFSSECMESLNLACLTDAVSQSCAKIGKIYRLWPKSNQFWRWSGYISKPNFRPFLQGILLRMHVTPKFGLFH